MWEMKRYTIYCWRSRGSIGLQHTHSSVEWKQLSYRKKFPLESRCPEIVTLLIGRTKGLKTSHFYIFFSYGINDPLKP